jgi:alkylation response protein AidB-like acyl-CoA dehydrogenase
MGMRATGSHDLVFDSARLAPETLIQQRDLGTADPGKASGPTWFGLCTSAVYLGIAAAARDAAINFAHERKPTALGGKSIATLEVIQQRLGALETELLPARAFLYTIADAWNRDPNARQSLPPYIGQAKVVATTHAIAAVDLALRVVGGQSMQRSLPLERLFRDVRAGLFHPPPEETANTTIGRALLGL